LAIHVLITGAAGNQAHFIWNALRRSCLDVRVVGCNYSPEGAGLYQFDAGYVVPGASDPQYLPQLLALCKRERIGLILVGNMAEMRVLARHRHQILAETGATVVTSPPEALQRMEDKWELTRYLGRAGFDFPRSALPSDRSAWEAFLAQIPFPYVVKDRLGAGSQGLGIARNRKQLDYLIETIPNPLVQEYLHPDDQEYTVGVFLEADSRPAASIVMKRQLGLGMTWRAETLPDSPFGEYCERVLAGSGCIGPCNVQLRLTERGPVIFEVNPRFSSTTSARAYYGYNEPEMCIRHFVLREAIRRPTIREVRFYRVIEDVFVSDEAFNRMRHTGAIENTQYDTF